MYTAFIILPQNDDVQCYTQTNTYAVIKLEPLTTRSICSSLRCVSAAEHHTAEHYTKADRIKLRKHLPRSSLQLNTRQDFLKVQAFEKLPWKPSEDASQISSWNQMSLPIYQGHQTPSAQLSQSFMGVTLDALCVTWRLSYA